MAPKKGSKKKKTAVSEPPTPDSSGGRKKSTPIRPRPRRSAANGRSVLSRFILLVTVLAALAMVVAQRLDLDLPPVAEAKSAIYAGPVPAWAHGAVRHAALAGASLGEISSLLLASLGLFGGAGAGAEKKSDDKVSTGDFFSYKFWKSTVARVQSRREKARRRRWKRHQEANGGGVASENEAESSSSSPASSSGTKPAGHGEVDKKSFASKYEPYTGRVFTVEELAQFHGGDRSPDSIGALPKTAATPAAQVSDPDFDAADTVLIAIVGEVYDVSKGKEHYARGTGGYGGFGGRDGSRAFTTGEFNDKGLIPDLSGLTNQQVASVLDWLSFYENEDKYPFVGRLAGHFYDSEGRPTQALRDAHAAAQAAKTEQSEEEKLAEKYPPCNSRWAQGKGGEFWCAKDSGGQKRDWVGYVRELRIPKYAKRCACIHPDDADFEHAHVYEGCGPKEEKCKNPNAN